MPSGQIEPVATDQEGAAAVAPSAAAGSVVDVAGIDMLQPTGAGEVAGTRQCRGWRCRLVTHLPVRVEGGEMHRHVGAERCRYPAAQSVDLPLGIVLAGNQQGGDLQPDAGLSLEVDERVEHTP